ncbi:MAG: hypothetical protein KC619_26070 [Myxococcales bacterium]|nr:hypothetical protein [Myxococcales bacterium]
MTEYRDEKETLRRRVAALEAELAAREGEDAIDERLRLARAERDALKDERDALRAERDALRREVGLARAGRPSTWDRKRRWLTGGLLGAAGIGLLLGLQLVFVGASAGVTAAAFIVFFLSVLAALVLGVRAIDEGGRAYEPPEPVENRVERSAREERRERRKRRRKLQARVEAERHEVSVQAKTRHPKRRRR